MTDTTAPPPRSPHGDSSTSSLSVTKRKHHANHGSPSPRPESSSAAENRRAISEPTCLLGLRQDDGRHSPHQAQAATSVFHQNSDTRPMTLSDGSDESSSQFQGNYAWDVVHRRFQEVIDDRKSAFQTYNGRAVSLGAPTLQTAQMGHRVGGLGLRSGNGLDYMLFGNGAFHSPGQRQRSSRNGRHTPPMASMITRTRGRDSSQSDDLAVKLGPRRRILPSWNSMFWKEAKENRDVDWIDQESVSSKRLMRFLRFHGRSDSQGDEGKKGPAPTTTEDVSSIMQREKECAGAETAKTKDRTHRMQEGKYFSFSEGAWLDKKTRGLGDSKVTTALGGDLLYHSDAIQCPQCGVRGSDGAADMNSRPRGHTRMANEQSAAKPLPKVKKPDSPSKVPLVAKFSISRNRNTAGGSTTPAEHYIALLAGFCYGALFAAALSMLAVFMGWIGDALR